MIYSLYDGQRVVMCPPPADMSPDITSNNIQSDLASGRITARFKHEKDTEFATLTGTFKRSTDKPPYTFSGSGSFRGPTTKDSPGKWIWQSQPPLRCQSLGKERTKALRKSFTPQGSVKSGTSGMSAADLLTKPHKPLSRERIKALEESFNPRGAD